MRVEGETLRVEGETLKVGAMAHEGSVFGPYERREGPMMVNLLRVNPIVMAAVARTANLSEPLVDVLVVRVKQWVFVVNVTTERREYCGRWFAPNETLVYARDRLVAVARNVLPASFEAGMLHYAPGLDEVLGMMEAGTVGVRWEFWD